MGEGITHIISSASAVWCGWMMLGLLLCGILSELFQPGVISQAKGSLAAQGDRLYKESPNNFMGQLMITLFRVGVITMAVYLCCDQTPAFSFTGFWVIFGIVMAVSLVKMLLNIGTDYTFRLSRSFGNGYEHYGNILTLGTVILYPVVLVLMRFGDPLLNRWIVGGVGALFVATWLYCAFRQFVHTPRAILYLLVYMVTVEALPWVFIFMLSNQIIAQL